MTSAEPRFADPNELAHQIAAATRPLLVATDIDGTISPIAPTPESAALVPGALGALSGIHSSGHAVAVLSGRPLVEIREQFGLPDHFLLVGSHGAEPGGSPRLTEDERALLAEVTGIVEAIAAEVPGARVERKPYAAALHVRRAEEAVGDAALARLRDEVSRLAGITHLAGHRVLEVAVRATTKATAMADLRRLLDPATVVFIGDDRSDEGVFASLTADDVAVKVGVDESVAWRRLRGPDDVVRMLSRLADLLAA